MLPQRLHAVGALWSLHAIWPQLAEAARNASEAVDPDRGTLKAWKPGSGVHSGRTGDQILDAILRHATSGVNPYLIRSGHAAETVDWIAQKILGRGSRDIPATLQALVEAVPRLEPGTALNIALWIGAEDRKVRDLLAEKPDYHPLPGLRCPYCGTAGALAMRSSAPGLLERPIVCTAGCTCDGPQCPCGMGSLCPCCGRRALVEGLPHIWDQEQLTEALDSKDKPMNDLFRWYRHQLDVQQQLFTNWPGDPTAAGAGDGRGHETTWSPAHGLAEVAARRRVLDLCDQAVLSPGRDGDLAVEVVRLLAEAEDRSPGYRESWRP